MFAGTQIIKFSISKMRRAPAIFFSSLAFAVLMFTASTAWAATYTWVGGSSAPWTTDTSWNPLRSSPASDDVIVFNNVGSVLPTGFLTQTIGQMQITGNSEVTLRHASNSTLTISGGSGTDLLVEAGATFVHDPNFGPLHVRVAGGATGIISGTWSMPSLAHTLDAVDANGIFFESGSVCGAYTPGAIFTTSGTPNAVHFRNGSTLSVSGPSPFGLAAPNSKIVLDAGSLFIDNGYGTNDYSGRTYGNYRFNAGGGYVASATGSGTLTAYDFEVTDGTLNMGMTGAFNIKGDLSVSSGKTLNFNAASPAVISLNGVTPQTITVSGNLTVSGTETFDVDNASGVFLGGNLTLPNGNLNFVNGTVTTGTQTLTIASTADLTAAGPGTGWVIGNLKRNVPVTGARVFDIGSTTNYLPVALLVNGLAGAFDLTASTSTPDHPALASSALDPDHSVNRYWTLTPSTTPTFANYDATFNFPAEDVDGGSNTAGFRVAKYSSSSWSLLSAGATSETSTQATGATSFSDFAVGQISHTITASAGANGSITPSGAVVVAEGLDEGFTIAADPGYYILDVLVDGATVGAVTDYTFTNVTADHTISASFATGCLTPPSGMVAWWPLDELSGTVATNIVGPANGSLTGAATYVAGKVANSVHLVNSAFVTVADDPSLDFGAGSFSIDAWVRTDDALTSVRTIVDKRGTGGIGYSMYISFGHLGLQIADPSGNTNYTSATGSITDGGWHHVAATVDRAGGTTGGKLYLDGALVLTFDPTLRPGSVSNDGALRLGQPGISFNGDIDEVELFSRALTLTEVSQIFQADSSGKCKPAVVGVSDAPPSTNPMMALTNNPIRSGHTEIRLSLAQEERVEISVFDISGRVVYTTEPRTMAAGEHKIPWNATGANGRRLMGGIYFVKVRLSLSGVEITKKFVIIR